MIPYILQSAIILSVFTLFYNLLLSKETLFKLHRFLLLGCLFLSVILPFLQVPKEWSFRDGDDQKELMVTSQFQETVAVRQHTKSLVVQNVQNEKSTQDVILVKWMEWLVWLYWFGVAVFGLSFLFQIFILIYKAYSQPYSRVGNFRIVKMSGHKTPCSFNNCVFINPDKYDKETYNQILAHEMIHVQQKHSIDLIIAELLLVFQWFNPFAWLYRNIIENNLEFLTDDEMIRKKGVSQNSYQLSLLMVSVPQFSLNLTTNFNQSFLRRRLIMMNSKKSNLTVIWKYLFILPFLILFPCLFNKPIASDVETVNTDYEMAVLSSVKKLSSVSSRRTKQRQKMNNPKTFFEGNPLLGENQKTNEAAVKLNHQLIKKRVSKSLAVNSMESTKQKKVIPTNISKLEMENPNNKVTEFANKHSPMTIEPPSPNTAFIDLQQEHKREAKTMKQMADKAKERSDISREEHNNLQKMRRPINLINLIIGH